MLPLIGAGIMAGATIGSSLLNNYYNSKAQDRELAAKKEAADELKRQGQITDQEYRDIIGQIESYYANRQGIGQTDDISKYRQAIEGYSTGEDEMAGLNTDFDKTGYNKTQEDFVNPYYSRIIGDTANQIQHTAAGAGIGRGTGAALNIAKGTAEKSNELYREANDMYESDRNFAYKKFQDAIDNQLKKLNYIRQGQQYQIGNLGNLAKDYTNIQDQAMSDQLQAQQDRMNARVNYASAMAGLY
jgi:hypothetical protein